MILRFFALAGIAFVLIAGFCVGCGKSSAPAAASGATNGLSTVPSLRLHWLGKKKMAAEADATSLMTIWRLPESVRLEAQTLDKLATAPWQLWTTKTVPSNAPSALLRPLLEDLISEESYLEAFGDTNCLSEFVLAVKLSEDRALVWQTNLPIVLHSLFGLGSETHIPTLEPDAVFKSLSVDYTLRLGRSGEWTLFSIATRSLEASALLNDFRERITAAQSPFQSQATNNLLELQVDFGALPRWALLRGLQSNQPKLNLKIVGENRNKDLYTSGELIFPNGAPIEKEAWKIPTVLVHDPLISFTSWRGFRPLLKHCMSWDESQLGDMPSQATFWVQSGMPALRFFSFPSLEASNQLSRLNDFVLSEINPHLAKFPNTTNVPLGSFELSPVDNRLRWRGIPYILPNLDRFESQSNAFIIGGLFPNRTTNIPAPKALFSQLKDDSDLVFYDWELTEPSEFGLIQVSQAIRFVFGRNRLSMTNNPGLPWLVAVSTNLGNCTTSIRLANPNSLVLQRSSTIGLSSLEIHLLVEWLESQTFPKGFFSLPAAQE